MLLVAPRIVNSVSCVKRIQHEIHFSWQAQHLVKFMCYFSWQAQYLVKFKCHFSWQAQYSVKFGMIAGARNVVIFNRICFWRARKVTSAARRVAVCEFVVGSCSDRSRIGNDVSSVFTKFFSDFGRSFSVAGAVFGEVGGCCLSLRAL